MTEPVAVDQLCLYCSGDEPQECVCDLWCGHADCRADLAVYDDDIERGPLWDGEPYVRPVEDVPTRGLL